jgi:hypothetical protein
MKATFNKSLIAAGFAASLAGVSGNSQAAIATGDAAEAFLIPFAYWIPSSSSASGFDTVVNFTIPSTVGGKTIPNIYLANNTTPRGAVVQPPVVSLPPNQQPFAAFLLPFEERVWSLHYYFESYDSIDICSGDIPITPELWDAYTLSELCPGLPDTHGYLLLTTGTGAQGLDANFAFFTDAWLTVDNRGGAPLANVGDLGAWSLPTLGMPDGDDAQGITQFNQIVETAAPTIDARPIYSGIGTSYPNAPATARKVIDLSLAHRTDVETAGVDYYTRNMLIVWNDSNFEGWSSVGYHLFNDFEEGCNGAIPLPWELNVIWFTEPGDSGIPFFIPNQQGFNNVTEVAAPGYIWKPALCRDELDAFVRLQLPLENTGTTFADRTAMYAFSLAMWWSGAPVAAQQTPVLGFAYPREGYDLTGDWLAWEANPSTDAHDRGIFATTVLMWTAPGIFNP